MAAGLSGEERPSILDTTPTALAPVRVAVEGGATASPFRSLLLNSGRWVEQMMAQVCPPELQRELSDQGARSFRDAYVAHLWVSVSVCL